MSSRQRSRLANQALLSSLTAAVESEEEEEEVEEENTANQLKRTFALYSSSSEHDSSANESEGSVHTGQIKNHKVQAASTDNAHPSQLMTTLDELAYLDTVIEQNTQDITQTEKSPAALVTDVYSSLFRIENARNLDVTAALRRRQGEPVFPDDNDHQLAGRRGNNANRMAVRGGAGRAQQLGGIINRPLNSKRYVFGAPSEDWTRPPAFMAGGIGMSKVATKHRHRQQYANARLNMNGNDKYYTSSDNVCEWYAFDWSGEFRFLHDQYQYIEDTGDANLLVMFLTHFPHHTPGLLQLSMVYARMQQLDKAADLVRRALYVLECAALESFKPPAVAAAATVPENMKMRGAMRMDPYVVENGAYFAVLYRHMQICSMQGHHSVAVDVCRYLLSLHPADDAQHLLLTLDYYLIRAENHALLLAFCGLTPQSLCDKVSASAADDSSAGVCQFVWSSPYQFDLFSPVPVPVVEQNEKVSTGAKEGVARAADSDKRKDGNSTAAHSNAHNSHSNSMSVGLDTHGSRALQHLPNWWFSLALSRWIVEQQPQQQQQQQPQTLGAATGTGRMRAGTYLLKAALFRWPFMLAPLLRKIGVDTTAAWRPILTHEWFKNAEKR